MRQQIKTGGGEQIAVIRVNEFEEQINSDELVGKNGALIKQFN